MKHHWTYRLICALLVVGAAACGGKRAGDGCAYSVGALRFDADELVFDTVPLRGEGVRTLRIYNPTASPVTLEQAGRLSGFRLYYEGEELGLGGVEIPAGGEGELRVVFRPDRDTLLGDYFDRLRFFVDRRSGFSEGLYVKAYVRGETRIVAGGPAPRLEVERPEFGFSPVCEGDTVVGSFRLRNTGTAALLIRKVETSCGCTVVALADRLLLPGAERTVRVTLSTRGLLGFQRKRVVLHTNDPASPAVTLLLCGDVRPRRSAEY